MRRVQSSCAPGLKYIESRRKARIGSLHVRVHKPTGASLFAAPLMERSMDEFYVPQISPKLIKLLKSVAYSEMSFPMIPMKASIRAKRKFLIALHEEASEVSLCTEPKQRTKRVFQILDSAAAVVSTAQYVAIELLRLDDELKKANMQLSSEKPRKKRT
jgi:hypothetical protein